MSNYTLAVSWSGKDALADSDANKVISGGDFHTEFTAVKAAVNTKADINGSASETFSATTASANTNTTQVATTAYVQAEITAAAINAVVYPVGSIYFNAAVATNPATLLGFGTWAAYGGGRVMVGVHSSGTFDGLNETGGAETHQLTINELPSHTHQFADNTGTTNVSIDDIGHTIKDRVTSTTGATGGGAAHNNIQPYITVYMWKRTG